MNEAYPRFTHDRGRLVIQPCAGAPLQILDVVDGEYRWTVLPSPVPLAVALGTSEPRQLLIEWPTTMDDVRCGSWIYEMNGGRVKGAFVELSEGGIGFECSAVGRIWDSDSFEKGESFTPVED